jgi:hypothetical protein
MGSMEHEMDDAGVQIVRLALREQQAKTEAAEIALATAKLRFAAAQAMVPAEVSARKAEMIANGFVSLGRSTPSVEDCRALEDDLNGRQALSDPKSRIAKE